jgi:hypothetical protein
MFGFGALLEFGGIVALGFPDFLPGAQRLSRWLRVRGRSLVNRVRRLLGLPPLRTTVSASAALEADSAVGGSAVKSVSAEATLEEQVLFLLQRDQEAQRDVNTLGARMAAMEAKVPDKLEELRGQMETHVEQKLEAAEASYRSLRVLGAVLLACGLILTTLGNFVC